MNHKYRSIFRSYSSENTLKLKKLYIINAKSLNAEISGENNAKNSVSFQNLSPSNYQKKNLNYLKKRKIQINSFLACKNKLFVENKSLLNKNLTIKNQTTKYKNEKTSTRISPIMQIKEPFNLKKPNFSITPNKENNLNIQTKPVNKNNYKLEMLQILKNINDHPLSYKKSPNNYSRPYNKIFPFYINQTKKNILNVNDSLVVSNNEFANQSEESRYEKLLLIFTKLRNSIIVDKNKEVIRFKNFLYSLGIRNKEYYKEKYIIAFLNWVKDDNYYKYINPNETIANNIINIVTNYSKYNPKNIMYNSKYISKLPRYIDKSLLLKKNFYEAKYVDVQCKLKNIKIDDLSTENNNSNNDLDYQKNKIKLYHGLIDEKNYDFTNSISKNLSEEVINTFEKQTEKNNQITNLYTGNNNLYLTEIDKKKEIKLDNYSINSTIFENNNNYWLNRAFTEKKRMKIQLIFDKNFNHYFSELKKDKKITDYVCFSKLRNINNIKKILSETK